MKNRLLETKMNTKDVKVDFTDFKKTIEDIERRINIEIEIKNKFKKDIENLRNKLKKQYKNVDIEFVFIFEKVKND
jgi:hypothetical protein